MEYVLRHPTSVAAIVVFTGGLMGPAGTEWKTAGGQSLKGLNVFLTGSDVDEWIEESRTRETARVLQELGASVEMRIYPGRPHVVSKEELNDAREFLAAHI